MARTGVPAAGFSLWRIGLWLVLLLAAFGCLQYLWHAQQVWTLLGADPLIDPTRRSALHGLLAWDAAYFLASFALIVGCAGGILRQAWARPALRVALTLLALWFLVSAAMLYQQWQAWHQLQTAVDGSAALLQRDGRRVQMALAFKLVAAPLLLWLVWRLGRPTVRAQFLRRR